MSHAMSNAADLLFAPRSTQLRRTMVDCQLRTFDVTDADVLSAVLDTPREPFMSEQVDSLVYSDAALLARGAHTSRRLLVPMVVARAFQEARLTTSDRALDVGGAGGYSAAILARLVGSVIALDDDSGFVETAQRGFSQLRLSNARALKGELSAGLPGEGPFDVILVNGAIGGWRAPAGGRSSSGRRRRIWANDALGAHWRRIWFASPVPGGCRTAA